MVVASLETDFTLAEADSVVDHDAVLLQSDLLHLEVARLLSQEVHFVDVVLLIFPEVLLQIVNVLQNFFQDVVEALGGLVLESSALRPQQLRVLLVIVQALDAVLDISLKQISLQLLLTSIC